MCSRNAYLPCAWQSDLFTSAPAADAQVHVHAGSPPPLDMRRPQHKPDYNVADASLRQNSRPAAATPVRASRRLGGSGVTTFATAW